MATNFLDYKVPMSAFQKTTKFLAYHISARKLFREILKWLHVPVYDCACPDDTVGVPVKFNPEDDEIQRYDGTEWITVLPTTGVSEDITIEATDGTHVLTYTNGILTNAVFTPTP